MEDVEPGPAGPPMPAPPPAHQAAFGPLAGPHADAWGPQQPEPMDQEPWQPAHDLWDEPWPQPQPQLWAFVGGQWQLVPPAVLHAHPELWQQALQQQAWQEQAWQQQALQQQQLAIEQQQQAWQGAAPLAAPARPAESDCSSVRRPGGGGAPGSPTASSACSVPASRRLASHERNARHMRQLEQYVRQASRTVDPRRPALLDPAIPLPPLRQPPPNEDVRLIATRQLPCWPPRERRGTGAGAEQGLGPGGSELQADGTGAGPGPGSDADRHHQQAGAPMQAREEGPLPDVGPGEGGGREVAMGTEV
ncbi:hypothetical protein HYH03_014530 [Edaphochlamys debaryana]|uniref:Uncharacterized protein n=1 Tax=Edaphochlamys debaryana TaxID=47281 RepID=A0A835XNX6_9CHLO|nr:hypothetical protein HYH03_014530 [Edaphochlamys debaryana]|eukprot:KAG2486847.1 hypothetical protein HYH03_014530 [Edaphochlamys debaryana]